MNEEYIILRKILKIGNRLINNRNKSLKEHDLTSEQSVALQFLDAHSGASAADLKEHLDISHQAARNIIERMKKKELLYSTVSIKDARIRPVFLTSKGEDVCITIKKEGSDVECQLLSGLSVEEKDSLNVLLDKISRTIS